MSTRMGNAEMAVSKFHSQLINVETPAPNEVRELIAKRAYELYQIRGDRFGDAISDWLQAEDEVVTMFLSLPIEPAQVESSAGPRPTRSAFARTKKSNEATRKRSINGKAKRDGKQG